MTKPARVSYGFKERTKEGGVGPKLGFGPGLTRCGRVLLRTRLIANPKTQMLLVRVRARPAEQQCVSVALMSEFSGHGDLLSYV